MHARIKIIETQNPCNAFKFDLGITEKREFE
jgi:hypothetical protein